MVALISLIMPTESINTNILKKNKNKANQIKGTINILTSTNKKNI